MLASVLLCAGLLLTQDASADEKNKLELEKLQGRWVLATFGSRAVSPESATSYIIKGNEYTFEAPGGETGKVTFKIDATKDPKTLDLTNASGAVQLCIYKLEGDTLTICKESESGVRPTEFKPAGNGRGLSVWKRVKEPAK